MLVRIVSQGEARRKSLCGRDRASFSAGKGTETEEGTVAFPGWILYNQITKFDQKQEMFTMRQIIVPPDYTPLLSIYETQKAISLLKRLFEDKLAGALRLHRVSAPLFVSASSGLNDDLNGVERPVAFDINGVEGAAQVVHSLAKWKRFALKRYQFQVGEGLYTDMNAIRRDEELDNLHSAYVDQWDWEKIIAPEDRNADYLKRTVRERQWAARPYRRFFRSSIRRRRRSRACRWSSERIPGKAESRRRRPKLFLSSTAWSRARSSSSWAREAAARSSRRCW